MIRRKFPHGQKYQVIEIPYKGDGNDSVGLHGNKIRIGLQCIALFSICMQNFIEFEVTITELCSVMYSINILIQLVTTCA